MTVADVATMLNMTEPWVYEKARFGYLPSIKIGSSVRFVPAEISAYIEAHHR
jgi:excisionase family DNA binding protein